MARTVIDRVVARALVLAIDSTTTDREAVDSLIAVSADSPERLFRAARLLQYRMNERPSTVRTRALRLINAAAVTLEATTAAAGSEAS
ncbi:MAG: hypothetical protein S0880_24990 [Actinomycetota bacterium]|nr:hypothetical protein [Actinomycetota bacterium]